MRSQTKAGASAEGEPVPGHPLSETLAAVAREMGDLAQVGDRLQALISAALVADSAGHADHLKEFQAIDLLVQRLYGVSIFVDALARTTPGNWRIDTAAAADEVVLSDLARRLAGRPDPVEEPDAGDLQLFG